MEFPKKVERVIEFLSVNLDITHEQAFEMLDSTRDIWDDGSSSKLEDIIQKEKEVSLIKDIPVELFEIVMLELTFDEKVKLCSVDQGIRRECIARKKYLFKIPHQAELDERFRYYLNQEDLEAADFFVSLGADVKYARDVFWNNFSFKTKFHVLENYQVVPFYEDVLNVILNASEEPQDPYAQVLVEKILSYPNSFKGYEEGLYIDEDDIMYKNFENLLMALHHNPTYSDPAPLDFFYMLLDTEYHKPIISKYLIKPQILIRTGEPVYNDLDDIEIFIETHKDNSLKLIKFINENMPHIDLSVDGNIVLAMAVETLSMEVIEALLQREDVRTGNMFRVRQVANRNINAIPVEIKRLLGIEE